MNGERSAPTAAPARTPSPDRLSMIVSWFRGFRELIAVLIFFVTGLIWIVNYFATRAELEEYRCINDATVKMIQNTMDANFMDELIKGNRREARENHSREEQQPHESEGYKAISDILDDLSSQLTDFQDKKKTAKKKADEAFETLRTNACSTNRPKPGAVQLSSLYSDERATSGFSSWLCSFDANSEKGWTSIFPRAATKAAGNSTLIPFRFARPTTISWTCW